MKVFNYYTKELLATLSNDRKQALKELQKLSYKNHYLVHSVRGNCAFVFVN